MQQAAEAGANRHHGLLGAGGAPRYVIGTVNAREFLVALAVSFSFLLALLTGRWEVVGGIAYHRFSG